MQQSPPIPVGTYVGSKYLEIFSFGITAIADEVNERIKHNMDTKRQKRAVARFLLLWIISRVKSSWDKGIDGIIANMMDVIAR